MKNKNFVVIGDKYRFKEMIRDTHLYAQNLIKNEEQVEGLAIATLLPFIDNEHSKGKWDFSCSIIFLPRILRAHDNFYLNIIASISLCGAINEMVTVQNKAYIKWPNLICVGKNEIAVIQISYNTNQKRISSAVSTILIKVEALEFLSIRKRINDEIVKEELFNAYEAIVEKFFSRLTDKYYLIQNWNVYHVGIREQYNRMLYKFREWSSFKTKKLLFLSGKIHEANSIGQIVVELKDGTFKRFSNGEINYLE